MRYENMAKKPTFNDIINERPADLMRHYKLSEKQMGQVVQSHSNDIKCREERRRFYSKVYDNKR